MVKGICSFVLMLTVAFCAAQDGPFTYNEVVKADSASAQQLYARARRWVDSTYTKPQSVIQTDDKENYTLVIKAGFIVHVTDGFDRDGGHVTYNLTIQCKNGRYKLSITDFTHHQGTSDLGNGGDLNKSRPACSLLNMPKYYWHQIKDQATERRNNLIVSVKQTLGFTPQPNQSNNW